MIQTQNKLALRVDGNRAAKTTCHFDERSEEKSPHEDFKRKTARSSLGTACLEMTERF